MSTPRSTGFAFSCLIRHPGRTSNPRRIDQRLFGHPDQSQRVCTPARMPIVHFACHGATNPSDPSQSLLLLQDHDSAPLTVASLAPVDLGQAQLAYLSACETALTFAPGLIDEAIHLTTAF